MIEQLKQLMIEDLKKELEQIQIEQQSGKYNWLERKITKQKEYYKWYCEIEDKIISLKEQIEKLENIDDYNDLKISFEQGMKILLEHGVSPTLTENDIINLSKKHHNTKPGIDNIDGLIMCHKRSHPPKNDIIQTAKSAGIVKKEIITIGAENKEVEINNYRDTIHFVVNGEVCIDDGPWYDSKYAILIPMRDFLASDTNKENFNLCPGSAYKKGDVKLTANSWLLVPQEEVEEQKRNNPNVNVIGYEGANVSKYAATLIKMLGYTYERDSGYNWSNPEDQAKYTSLITGMGYQAVGHNDSTDMYMESMTTCIDKIGIYLDHINNNPELLNNHESITLLAKQIAQLVTELLSRINGTTNVSNEKVVADLCTCLSIKHHISLPVEGLKHLGWSDEIGKLIVEDLKNKLTSIDKSKYAVR